mmetsp:Transcript_35020/g.111413  ORF Transcript_35020/g.111413 Transcript_35020/m.111413 type:complete len:133 (+) Transcript_35020:915-1313(+)
MFSLRLLSRCAQLPKAACLVYSLGSSNVAIYSYIMSYFGIPGKEVFEACTCKGGVQILHPHLPVQQLKGDGCMGGRPNLLPLRRMLKCLKCLRLSPRLPELHCDWCAQGAADNEFPDSPCEWVESALLCACF